LHAAFLWAIGHEAEPSRAEAIEIWFSDEARIGQKNKITRRWAKRGTRPSAPRDQRTTSTYIFGAVCPKLGKGAALILPACNTEAMNLHLAEIALRSPRRPRRRSGKYQKLLFCYEARPNGYGSHRQITAFGHACSVIAPSLIPKRPGEHIKTNRRDALTLARLRRAGELTTIWVPDPGHEAIRDLVPGREAAMEDLRAKRQHLPTFLLRHGRVYPGLRSWTLGARPVAVQPHPSSP
jgi:hypothetical protein